MVFLTIQTNYSKVDRVLVKIIFLEVFLTSELRIFMNFPEFKENCIKISPITIKSRWDSNNLMDFRIFWISYYQIPSLLLLVKRTLEELSRYTIPHCFDEKNPNQIALSSHYVTLQVKTLRWNMAKKEWSWFMIFITLGWCEVRPI